MRACQKIDSCIPNINILVLETGGPNVHANGLISLPCTWFKRKRCSLANGYLRNALKKVEFHPGSEPNDFVDVRSYAHVLEIIWDEENKKENIATDVRYFCNGTVREAFIAQKEKSSFVAVLLIALSKIAIMDRAHSFAKQHKNFII
ncbi:hypothetical protein C2G38_2034614 [Gigaspora rosea]|uniref:Uncharacterized protein n=1 Tax=Gigaspora rosea TaxID=44941 RepID=A0A397VPQ7_9GLOM|nr:hypothetical protein C2G38_2034614 [Gigaspora rosea]